MFRASFSRRGWLALGLCLFASPWVRGTEPRVARLDDLVIFQPNDHERGLPKVEFTQTPEGGLKVDPPPSTSTATTTVAIANFRVHCFKGAPR
ncbi:MAG: hypothetical protein U1D30_12285 [Planctomycetota bacterium]